MKLICLTLQHSAKMMLYDTFLMTLQVKSLSPISKSSQLKLYSSESANIGEFFSFQ